MNLINGFTVSDLAQEISCHLAGRYVSRAIRSTFILLLLTPALAVGGDEIPIPADEFYITITANDIYLCGEGFGGIYGCIDEAISREAHSVVISASNEATRDAVQALLKAAHAVGFDSVGLTSFNESDT